MKILIAPFSAKLHSNAYNPKNFPHWDDLVALLKGVGHEVIQIGVSGELRIEGVDQYIINWPLPKLRELIDSVDLWVSVDSWMPHFCKTERLKSGVVIWGPSDPKLFGYTENVNIWLGRGREWQYDAWGNFPYDPTLFPSAHQVFERIGRTLF